jgi:peptide/nickel transport system substrate-binding protein
MDEQIVPDNNGLEVVEQTNLPLLFFNKSSATEMIPVLAKSWTESADGLTYTFYLRSNVYFNNGDAFNAYAVWWNIYRLYVMNYNTFVYDIPGLNGTGITANDVNGLDNSANTPSSALLQVMENPHNSVTVVNATEVQFHLGFAFEPFLSTLGTPPWCFVDPYFVEQHGGVVANTTSNAFMSVNGTQNSDGPYVVSNYVPNQYVQLTANPHYWAQNLTGSQTNFFIQPAKIQQITIYYKTNELTRVLDVQNNNVQGATISYSDVQTLLKDYPNLYVPPTGPTGSLEFMFFDTLKAPLNNVLVREAITEAINVSQIQQIAMAGYGQTVVGPDLAGFFGYNGSIAPTPYNPTQAAQLLTQAGYPGGKGIPPLTFVYTTSNYVSTMAQLLVNDLNQIGITVQAEGVDPATAISLESLNGTAANAPDMQYGDWTFYPDASAYFPITDAAWGIFTYFHNQTIYNLEVQSNEQQNPTLRAQEISQVTVDLQKQYDFVWLAQDTDVYDTGAGFGVEVWNHCVTGMYYNTAFNGVEFNNLYYSCNPTAAS